MSFGRHWTCTLQTYPSELVSELAKILTSIYLETLADGTPSSAKFPAYKYVIGAVAFKDSGPGYDPQLTAFYQSTKSGARHLRGKYGEGGKMSALHMLRNRAKIIMRSLYSRNENSGDSAKTFKGVLWQARPVEVDGEVNMKGVQVVMPSFASTGSHTLIKFAGSDPVFRQEMREAVEPRLSLQGLHENCLDFASGGFTYKPIQGVANNQVLGVSTATTKRAYMQGLRVDGEVRHKDFNAYFSYDFVDSSLLMGRDRSGLKSESCKVVDALWSQTKDRKLLRTFFKHCFFVDDMRSTIEQYAVLKPWGFEQEKMRLYAEILEEVLSLRPKQPVIVLNPGMVVSTNVQKRLEELGIRSIIAKSLIPHNVFVYLADILKEKGIELYNVASLDGLIGPNTDTLSPQSEARILGEKLVEKAWSRVGGLVTDSEHIAIKSLIDRVEYIPKEFANREVITFQHHPEKNTYTMIVSPEYFAVDGAQLGSEYWELYIVVHMLAVLNKKSAFAGAQDVLQSAQVCANSILDAELSQQMPSDLAVPDEFHHTADQTTMSDILQRMQHDTDETIQQHKHWIARAKARKVLLTLEEMRSLEEHFGTFTDGKAKSAFYTDLHSHVCFTTEVTEESVEKRNVHFFRWNTDKAVVISRRVDELVVVAQWQGMPVLDLGRDRYIVEYPIPKNSLIEIGNKKLIWHGEYIFEFSDRGFCVHPSGNTHIVIKDGYIILDMASAQNPSRDFVLQELNAIKITALQPTETPKLEKTEDIIPTPLPIDYGKHEWDNPVRVLQDIHQNPIDALGENQAAGELFEVERDGIRRWLGKNHLTESDEILGYAVVDSGAGYAPTRLGTMGFTSKKSPLFSGKYGEGSKLIAAAAARNGISLSYTSVAEHNNEKKRWVADVTTMDEQFFKDGTPVNVKRIVFKQTTREYDPTDSYISGTILCLPKNADKNQQEVWQRWCAVFDPRQKNEAGHGGMARYVREHRRVAENRVIDMGVIKVLLDEPGCIYENGLLVTTDANTVVGYDTPSVVGNRERSILLPKKLEGYVGYVMAECPDIRFHIQVVSALAATLKQSDTGELKHIQSPLLELSGDTMHQEIWTEHKILSRPLWLEAQRKILGNKYFHSPYNLERRLEAVTSSSYAGQPEELHELQSIDRIAGSIPRENLILAEPNTNFSVLQWFFYTAKDFARKSELQSVNVSDETSQQLYRLVTDATTVIEQFFKNASMSEDRKMTLFNIIQKRQSGFSEFRYSSTSKIANAVAGIQNWLKSDAQISEQVFVSPIFAGYLGVADRSRIGINEGLLLSGKSGVLVSTIFHELGHKLFGLHDYKVEFIMYLLLMAEECRRLSVQDNFN